MTSGRQTDLGTPQVFFSSVTGKNKTMGSVTCHKKNQSFQASIKSVRVRGAWLAHLVEQAPLYRGLLLDAVAVGSTLVCGPFAGCHSPSLSSFKSKLSYTNKGLKWQKIS